MLFFFGKFTSTETTHQDCDKLPEAGLAWSFPHLFHLPKKQYKMKTRMNTYEKTDSLDKKALLTILEVQTFLNDYQLSGSSYDQQRTREIQQIMHALNTLMISILTDD